jgi:hypothetical protein
MLLSHRLVRWLELNVSTLFRASRQSFSFLQNLLPSPPLYLPIKSIDRQIDVGLFDRIVAMTR